MDDLTEFRVRLQQRAIAANIERRRSIMARDNVMDYAMRKFKRITLGLYVREDDGRQELYVTDDFGFLLKVTTVPHINH